MSRAQPGQAPLRLAVLGATGSIGLNTLDVVARHPRRYQVVALTAHRQDERLFALCQRHRPRLAVMADAGAAARLTARLRAAGLATEVAAGPEALVAAASRDDVDAVMAGIVGAAGLPATLAAARHGKRIMLANKEALVVAGRLFMATVEAGGAELLPVDSEHSALFQCMPPGYRTGRRPEGVRRLWLTASGGPFRTWPRERLQGVTPEQACAHPNWSMGRKISVDSATLMNKGLELIEACWLFGVTPDEVEVVVHPQSIIHSMVDYLDGSVLAQMGRPDMRTPISLALGWPRRQPSGVEPLDLYALHGLDFEPPDVERFPALRLAREAWAAGGTATVVLNAANEVAVEAFLDGRLAFTDIPRLIEAALETCPAGPAQDLDGLLAVDAEARARVRDHLGQGGRRHGP